MTSRGLESTQGEGGEDILTISRLLTPTYGDSLGFMVRRSAIRQNHWSTDDYSIFDIKGRDNIGDFIDLLPVIQPRSETDPEISEFPSDAQVFEQYTQDDYKHVGCVALQIETIEERDARDPMLKDLIEKANQVISITSTILGITEKDKEMVDVRAFGYPLGVQHGFRPVMLAEHTYDNLRLYFDEENRSRIPKESVK